MGDFAELLSRRRAKGFSSWAKSPIPRRPQAEFSRVCLAMFSRDPIGERAAVE